jgi:putative transposase
MFRPLLNEGHLPSIIASYLLYCPSARTHLSSYKDAPAGRAVQPPTAGKVTALPHLGGLHHEYGRLAA